MMYLFSGADGRSDRGFFEVIIDEFNMVGAKKVLQEELRKQGRFDLLDVEISCRRLDTRSSVIYSTIEKAR